MCWPRKKYYVSERALINHRGFTRIAVIVLVVLVLGVAGYTALQYRLTTQAPTTPRNKAPTPQDSNPLATNEVPPGWQLVDTGFFSVFLPPEWQYNKKAGIDSVVGEFVGDNITLYWEFGIYSGPVSEKDPKHGSITYETINGKQAQIVVPKDYGKGVTFFYINPFGSSSEAAGLRISAGDLTPSQQETSLQIFRTVRFKN